MLPDRRRRVAARTPRRLPARFRYRRSHASAASSRCSHLDHTTVSTVIMLPSHGPWCQYQCRVAYRSCRAGLVRH